MGSDKIRDAWLAQLHEPVMEVRRSEEGERDAAYGHVCITSNTREQFGPWHIWIRAAAEIGHMLDVPFAIRLKASAHCIDMANASRLLHPDFERPKPPQFSWKGIPGRI